ncbi:DUF805 domain-containing protein [Staphylococcus hyicus]|uniref:DUF805 domain-containing protein n=1 Tax=Staphylococcus hyicus TaxID=1284 RepID=UPI00211D1317|nr:DUF805 domain-containing protein [Staphylococcus hyicus]MCQ9291959.1 DUF805 domain-containing protein [Staphylococcus hyicus]MCQ9307200.1 DUF805 domain-containing protein [Staphylococcus hyicus]MCQ9309334.1 DUF805 domain-containing protein [Staphylococcus hyicus]MCQ9312034.1 DUF805 domain-containing protein [Staphylococcus hyicus]
MNQPQTVVSCYKLFWTRLFDIKGRSTRKEFWHPLWINAVIMTLLSLLVSERSSYIFSLMIFVPNLAVMTRRLHDVDRTMFLAIIFNAASYIGTFLFFIFILVPTGVVTSPFAESILIIFVFISSIALIGLLFYTFILMASRGNTAPNQYGNDGTASMMQNTKTSHVS